MKRVYIVGAEVHICETEEAEGNMHNFKAKACSAHPIYPAGTLLCIPKAGTVSFDIEDEEVSAVQQKVDEWKGVAKQEVKEVAKPAPKTPAAGKGVRKLGGK